MAKSTFRSQKCKKTGGFGAFFEVQTSKKCTPLRREADVEVKLLQTHHIRTTFSRTRHTTRHDTRHTRHTRHETREHETRDTRQENTRTRDMGHETRDTRRGAPHTTLDTRHTTRHLQPPVGPSVGSLCHPCITTIHLSYSALSLKLLPPPCAVLLVLELRRSLLSLANPNGKEECWRKMVRSTPLGQHATARNYVCFVFVFIPVRVVVRLRSCVCCMCVCARLCAQMKGRERNCTYAFLLLSSPSRSQNPGSITLVIATGWDCCCHCYWYKLYQHVQGCSRSGKYSAANCT